MKRYRAFISYSHRDETAARRLHRRIESYRPPKRLSGAPRRIAPVFRDREELATSSDLPGRLKEALDGAENLVVLCSPAAAASRWVNEEVALFAARHGAERIHPVIVDGEPPDVFPPALLDVAAAPLAADLREGKDGFADGALKLIAGLLPAPYGAVKDREIARARRRARINGAIAAVFAALALVAGWSFWTAMETTRAQEAELNRSEAAILTAVRGVEDIVDQVAAEAESGAIATRAAAGLLTAAQATIDSIVALAPNNPRLERERGDLLIEFARHYERIGDSARSAAASAEAEAVFRRLAADGTDLYAVK